jgi:hypothetical protein
MIVVIAHIAVLLGAVKILLELAGFSDASVAVGRFDITVVIHARPSQHHAPSGTVYYWDNTQEIHIPLQSLVYLGVTVGGFVAVSLALWALAAYRPVLLRRQAKAHRNSV